MATIFDAAVLGLDIVALNGVVRIRDVTPETWKKLEVWVKERVS